MRPGAAPISEQIMFDVIIPPVGAVLWWMMSRGWARSVQRGEISEQTRRRQKTEFWVILCLAYLLMFGITLYGFLT